MKQYIMALDQGTTSSRCILFNREGEVVSLAQKEFTQFYPNPGWVEHDPIEVWECQVEVAKEAMQQVGTDYTQIAAIGITNQRETTVVWDRNTGKPVYNAIVWQCRRTAEVCDDLKREGLESIVREKTGLFLDAYFSATKLKWILDHTPGAKERASSGELLFGTIDSWLVWNLTKGKLHITDYSNASRTMLYNINELQWDQEILDRLRIPLSILPEVRQSSEVYGYTDPSIFGGEIPIAAVAGDQQAALFGQTCFEAGMAKNTYGTGGFLLMNTGHKPVISNNGLLSTIAWGLDGKVTYALEGSIFVSGAAIQWLRDELHLIQSAGESENMAKSVPDTNGAYLVPAFVGLGAPYWDPYVRGTIVGLTRGVNHAHLVRAALESMAYQTHDVLLSMEEDAGLTLNSLRVDGGGSSNDFLLQFQSDVIQKSVIRPSNTELTALGAAYLAGLSIGYWANKEEILSNNKSAKQYDPTIKKEKQATLLNGWRRAVNTALFWAKEDPSNP